MAMNEKDKAIRMAILQRVEAIDTVLKRTNLSPMEKAYYAGKREGLMQGHDLAGSSLESIEAELR